MKKISVAIMMVVIYFILVSCQQIFTYSALEWAQRDPSDLSSEQQIPYAESALASGDVDAIINAYNALAGSDDPEVNLLASELAFAGSGVGDAIGEASAIFLGELDETEDPITIMDDLIGDLDNELLQGAVTEFESALINDAEPTEEQYINAAVSLVLVSAQDQNSDFEIILDDLADVDDGTVETPSVEDDFDPDWTDSQKSYYYILQAGITDITDLQDLF